MKSFEKGINAEKEIISYLIRKNCKILKTRFKTKYGEIDIIAKNNEDVLLFIEVKYRSFCYEEILFEIIQSKQKIRYYNATQCFLHENDNYLNYESRFDVAVIIGKKIKYFKNAWNLEDIEEKLQDEKNDHF